MKYKHVLALNPYFGSSTSTVGLFPPTGLEYIAAAMKGYAGKITLMDLRHEAEFQNPAALSAFIKKEIDLVCISIRWGIFFKEICELINQLTVDVPVVVGGYQATEEVEFLLEHCPNIGVVVRGEGEFIIREIVQGLPYKDIRGISYRVDGKIVHNENAQLPELALIPFPDRSMRKNSYYYEQHGASLKAVTFDTVLTTRGCPFKCQFCTFSLNPLGQKRGYAERPLADVIEELKTITADIIMLSDDNFFTNPRRSEELCDLIIANGIKKTFFVQTRIEIAKRPSLLEKAEKAGFKVLLIGVESPHDKILKHFQKGFTQDKIRRSFKELNKYNFYIHGYFIYANIGETEEEMVYIAQFARELKLDSISFHKLRVEKFSPLKEVVENTPGYYYEYIGGPVYSDTHSLKDLKRIRDRIKFGFYTPGQVLRTFKKMYDVRLLSKSAMSSFMLTLPVLLYGMMKREFRKKGWLS